MLNRMLGKYELIDVLGHGVSGIVYLARDTMLNRQVALKDLNVHAADVERFIAEARVMDRLRHEHIVRVHGIDRVDGHVVIDMEYVQGCTLQQKLRSDGPLPPDEALGITAQLLDALGYAHDLQVVHRDVKPENTLLSADGAVKLTDFGVAEILATNQYAGAAGTYPYMAPEAFADVDRTDRRTDLWAVGVTLYEMLTCERPFVVQNKKDPFAWKPVIEHDPPRPLPASISSRPLQAILDRALTRDKPLRYQSAAEFAADVRAVLQGADVASRTRIAAASMAAERRGAGQHVSRGLVGPYSGGPEVVVATAPPASRTRRWPLSRRSSEPAVHLSATAIDFRRIRPGEQRAAVLRTRTTGTRDVGGVHVSADRHWLEVARLRTRGRSTWWLVRARVPGDRPQGAMEGALHVTSDIGNSVVPVMITVQPPWRRFATVAPWFVPAVVLAALPLAAVVLAHTDRLLGVHQAAPVAAVAAATLAFVLLSITGSADAEPAARFAALGVFAATAGGALALAMRTSQAGETTASAHIASASAAGMLVVLLHLGSRRHWKAWLVALSVLGLGTTGLLLRWCATT